MAQRVIYKAINPKEHHGEGLTRELNVTGYVSTHRFLLRYIKIVHPLNTRDEAVDSAIAALRSIDSKSAGTLIEYLFEGCLMMVFDLDHHLTQVAKFKEFKDYFHGDKTTMLNAIFGMMTPVSLNSSS